MSRNRTARLAVLGSSVQRAASGKYTSRTSPALRRRIVLGMLLLLSLVLVTLYFREPQSGSLHSARSAGATLLKPFQIAADRVVRPFRDAYAYVDGLVAAKDALREVRDENRLLRQQATQYRFAFEESRELQQLLDYKASPAFPDDFEAVAAPVIAYPPSQFEQQLVLGAGSADGIRVNDPVVNEEGLVGKVTEVTAGTALVTLLTDAKIAVGARDLATDAVGVVRHGRAGEDALVLDLVEKRFEVKEGDDIVTAGAQRATLESPFPRGILIGTVTFVGQSDTDPYKQIQIEPAVDFGSLHSLLVLVPKGAPR
ncbi:MAG: rod shape-determining protein MreC [Gaiellaceae bacterium]